LPICSVIGYAVSCGVAPVYQKIGADTEIRPEKIDFTLLIRLLKNRPYLLATLFQLLGWCLGLIALRVLPLFLVQSIIAGSIVLTALAEKIITHRTLGKRLYWAIAVIICGIILLSTAAKPGRAMALNSNLTFGIEIAPIIIAAIGLICLYIKNKASVTLLALLSGGAFGGAAIIGRIIIYPALSWKSLANPMLLSLVAFALLGQFLFTVALQRTTGTITNALALATSTLAPAILGLVYFSDKIRPGFSFIVIIGFILTVGGSLGVAKFDPGLQPAI